MKRQAKSIFRKFTAEEKAHLADLQQKIEAERPEIVAKAQAFFAAQESSKAIIAQLKAERERQGLSLTDIKSRTGMTREAISAMENSESPNPTVKTLQRYAMALGVSLKLSIGKSGPSQSLPG